MLLEVEVVDDVIVRHVVSAHDRITNVKQFTVWVLIIFIAKL